MMVMKRMSEYLEEMGQTSSTKDTAEERRAQKRGWSDTQYIRGTLYGKDRHGELVEIPPEDQQTLADKDDRSGYLLAQKHDEIKRANGGQGLVVLNGGKK